MFPASTHTHNPAQVAAALSLWDKEASPDASFVFTGSMGVCSVDDGSVVREDCPVVAVGTSPGNDKLLGAEKEVIQVRVFCGSGHVRVWGAGAAAQYRMLTICDGTIAHLCISP
jgi:hypothetical protein